MKEIYKNSLGEQVIVKVTEGHCIINMKDETGKTAEICIPIEKAIGVAYQIIDECSKE